MQLNILRAATALLIFTTFSIGTNSIPAHQTPQYGASPAPVVLAAETTAVVKSELVKETTELEVPIIMEKAFQAPSPEAEPTPIPEEIIISEELKQREKQNKVLRLQKFLNSYNSPMADNAQDFIEAAEQYELDWKLVPSIAGVESTFGKFLIPGSHNAYGWGGGKIHFESWRDGIYKISKGLSERYIKKGLVTPHQIQPVYAPPSTTWGNKVTYFMNKLDSTIIDETENKETKEAQTEDK